MKVSTVASSSCSQHPSLWVCQVRGEGRGGRRQVVHLFIPSFFDVDSSVVPHTRQRYYFDKDILLLNMKHCFTFHLV